MKYVYSLQSKPETLIMACDGTPPEPGDVVNVDPGRLKTATGGELRTGLVVHRVIRVERDLLPSGEQVRVVLAEQAQTPKRRGPAGA